MAAGKSDIKDFDDTGACPICGEHFIGNQMHSHTSTGSTQSGASTQPGWVCYRCNQFVPKGILHECVMISNPPTYNLYPPLTNPEKGWICPRCDRIYSPSTTECPECNKSKVTYKGYTTTG
jgi:RNA polymerase subunit RPABC4/transcription elongation factor Spt4